MFGTSPILYLSFLLRFYLEQDEEEVTIINYPYTMILILYFLQCTFDSSVFTEESFRFLAMCSFPFGSNEDTVLL